MDAVNVLQDSKGIPSKESLLTDHLKHWTAVRKKWHATAHKNENRYEASRRILKAIYKSGVQGLDEIGSKAEIVGPYNDDGKGENIRENDGDEVCMRKTAWETNKEMGVADKVCKNYILLILDYEQVLVLDVALVDEDTYLDLQIVLNSCCVKS
uniref:Uncharacterized protein n=1 Tax=Timema douglasi TaxID=61478 RepID=A0A7R8ZBR0_TIMDO|nr:unnamed protein product [Timema douglasi]